MSWRRYGFGLAAFVAALVAADAVYWYWAGRQMRDGIQAWVAERSAEGWHIQTGALTVSGWPYRVEVRVPDVRADYDPGRQPGFLPEPVHLAFSEVRLHLPLYRPTTLTIALTGQTRAAVSDAAPIQLTGQTLEARLPLTEQPERSVAFVGRAVRIEPATRVAGRKTWIAHIVALDGRSGRTDPTKSPRGLDFTCSASGIELPAGFKYPLGSKVEDVSFGGTLNGPFPPGTTLSAAAEAWRDGGGSLEVKNLTVDWGPLRLMSSATLALDDQLQPMGSGSARVSGYDKALDRLAASGVLTRSAATVAKAMLSLLAGGGDGDTPSAVEVPLTLQYRTLSMRQLPLVRLPELDWPRP